MMTVISDSTWDERQLNSSMIPLRKKAGTSNSHLHNRCRKPLHNKCIVFDVENRRDHEALRKDVESLGGHISDTIDLDRKPWCIVSDYRHVSNYALHKRKGKQTLLSESQGTHSDSYDTSKLPMLLREAVHQRIMIKASSTFADHLNSWKRRLRNREEILTLKAPQKRNWTGPTVNGNIGTSRQLVAPFIKLQDKQGRFAPSYKEFSLGANWVSLYLNQSAGRSAFHKVVPKRSRTADDANPRRKSPRKRTVIRRFCEICSVDAEDIDLHLTGRDHAQRIAIPGFYDSVDELLGSYCDLISVRKHKSTG